MMKLTSLQISTLETYYKDRTQAYKHQRRIRLRLKELGLVQYSELTDKGLDVLFHYRPDLKPKNNVIYVDFTNKCRIA